MSSLTPWDVTPQLSRERIEILAREATIARNSVADLHEPHNGDDPWSLGCRAYSRTCFRLERLLENQQYPWLRITRRNLYFTLFVDGVPLKFYRGRAEEPNSRTLKSGLAEALRAGQTRLPFYDQEIAREEEGWFWLMAIDTDEDGRTLQVYLLQANKEGETKNIYAVVDDHIRVVAGLSDERAEAVELPPADIGVPGDELADADGDDEGT
jgi:hypothetical protein